MDTCDVLIVGGGPAGSSCAWQLRQAGLNVVALDAKRFPRDKVCAGWITPQVIEDLRLDITEYGRGRTLQPLSGFRVGLIDGEETVEITYDRPVSYGIRRCEFDHYLLQRSEAHLRLGTPISSIRRDGLQWIVNNTVKAPVLVGAGGHFCPVARMLNGNVEGAPLVVAQEVEFPLDRRDAGSFATAPEHPELYFCRDLQGYGWLVRKQDYLNVGFGRLDRHGLPSASAEFVAFLKAAGRIPRDAQWQWQGHAYLLSEPPARRMVDDGVMLVGDAAGLAYPQSGEGIRPAIESGLLAAATIVGANFRYSRDRLEPYVEQLHARYGVRPVSRLLSRAVPAWLQPALAPSLFIRPWFVRRLLLDRWFLHTEEPALASIH